MKRILLLAAALAVALAGCGDKTPPATQKSETKAARKSADLTAGRTLAEAQCKTCHGVDGKGAAP